MLKETSQASKAKNIKWYALVTKSRAEKKVAEYLTQQQWQTFLPLHTQWKQWSDRKKKVELPLIPSFVFVNVTEKQLLEVVKEDGVVRVLRYLGKPAIVRDDEIEILKLLTKNCQEIKAIKPLDLTHGELVEVLQGPFAGLKANYLSHQGKYKVIVNIEATGNYFQLEIAINNIQKISTRA
jgi:transcription antitermination factor NusG